MQQNSVDHIAQGKWVFDEQVAVRLNDMMARSIPGQRKMRRRMGQIIQAHAAERELYQSPRPYTVLDVGSATGCGLGTVASRVDGRIDYHGFDASLPMVDEARQLWQRRVKSWVRYRFEHIDVATALPLIEYGIGEVDLALCVFTLQFIGEDERIRVLEKVRDAMANTGILILVEKVDVDKRQRAAVRRWQHEFKKRHGYSEAAIAAKEESLNGVLVPWSITNNETACRSVGFDALHLFWVDMCFAGWVMKKI